MPSVPARKLPKTERRDQLLDTALAMVRDEGTDALTLARVAERAGVSKPVAYEHFGTRSGLLIALYRRLDTQQLDATLAALDRAPRTLDAVAQVLSQAYVACALVAGSAWAAVSAALKGDETMEAVLRQLTDDYVALYRDALAPYVDLPAHTLRQRCVALLGAGDALSREMIAGRIDGETAASELAALITRWLSRP
jgi:AcrR family transcriptional regulator